MIQEVKTKMPKRTDIWKIKNPSAARRAAIVAACLLCATVATAESVVVTKLVPQESSRHVRVAVVLNGKPVKGVKVDFCRTAPEGQACFSVLTGRDGTATLRALTLGDYQVFAVTADRLVADLYLHVSNKRRVTSFSLDLTKSFRAAQEAIAAAEKLPVREHVCEFRGTLQDPSGAPIPRADVEVVRKGFEGKDVLWLKSDAEGRFSTQLADGVYVAIFYSQGFRTEIVPFEITAQGEKEMLVKLRVGSTTESLQIATEQ
jgi:Carboxypeptidase regulatory-like domain